MSFKKLEIGDPVRVMDVGLLRLEAIARQTMSYGWVHEILDNGDIMVEFPIGNDNPDEHSQIAPYPKDMVRYNTFLGNRK